MGEEIGIVNYSFVYALCSKTLEKSYLVLKKAQANSAAVIVLLNFLVTVKAAPHECVNRTGLL